MTNAKRSFKRLLRNRHPANATYDYRSIFTISAGWTKIKPGTNIGGRSKDMNDETFCFNLFIGVISFRLLCRYVYVPIRLKDNKMTACEYGFCGAFSTSSIYLIPLYLFAKNDLRTLPFGIFLFLSIFLGGYYFNEWYFNKTGGVPIGRNKWNSFKTGRVSIDRNKMKSPLEEILDKQMAVIKGETINFNGTFDLGQRLVTVSYERPKGVTRAKLSFFVDTKMFGNNDIVLEILIVNNEKNRNISAKIMMDDGNIIEELFTVAINHPDNEDAVIEQVNQLLEEYREFMVEKYIEAIKEYI